MASRKDVDEQQKAMANQFSDRDDLAPRPRSRQQARKKRSVAGITQDAATIEQYRSRIKELEKDLKSAQDGGDSSTNINLLQDEINSLEERLKNESVLWLDPDEILVTRRANRKLLFLKTVQFQELKEQISNEGQLIPIGIKQSTHPDYEFELSYGRRRLEVCRLLGIKVKALYSERTELEALKDQFQENLRHNLSVFEESDSLIMMYDEHSFESDSGLAKYCGISPSKTSNLLSLRHIPNWLKDDYLTELTPVNDSEYVEISVPALRDLRGKFANSFKDITQEQEIELRDTLTEKKGGYFGLTKWIDRLKFIEGLLPGKEGVKQFAEQETKGVKPALDFDQNIRLSEDGKSFGSFKAGSDKGIQISISKKYYTKEMAKEIQDAVNEVIKKHKN